MDIEQAIKIIDAALKPDLLNQLELIVFRQAWEGKSYEEIAINSGYDVGHVKNVGYQLWKKLSCALGQRITKTNFRCVLYQYTEIPNFQQQTSATRKIKNLAIKRKLSPQQDWGELIDVSYFYGRTEELAILEQWIIKERCRLIAVLGMGGIGKTAFSMKLAQQLQGKFEYTIWCSLHDAHSVEEKLSKILQFLFHNQYISRNLNGDITELINFLQQHRCLLILDRVESIFHSGELAGKYRQGYEAYGELFKRIGESVSQSCVVLTSREKPKEIAIIEGRNLPVRCFYLLGLNSGEIPQLFKAKGTFWAIESDWKALENYSAGNPLILRMLATQIEELFDGNISEFINLWQQGQIKFENIYEILEEQVNRCSELEKEVLYWLAVHRRPVTLLELQKNILNWATQQKIPVILMSLERRSLILKHSSKFSLIPILMDYITNLIIQSITQEIKYNNKYLIYLIQLFQPQAREEIKAEQINCILEPIVENLRRNFQFSQELTIHLENMRSEMRSHISNLLGYGEINISYLKKVAVITNPTIQLIPKHQSALPIADDISYYRH
ncbi:hypothetical protein NIES2119_09805 [[Phormidium ambiguum] IAM M-71]|uniref:Uncharacterized protein n=1 Tax=[Phormidium ambiguum] IAM M-71 TaxID=454136 RepID=A0A1U7IM19_9CYAN|nr:NB-ARC domain-containing protein [Phormidium ambiguum]OKH38322.1 hypothetical protein NIES2119_09805 [Phormidium ambiguum IAM M-71]